jgi:flagellar hook protein FlgE
MFSSISGLNANSLTMEIIGNNLANVNTTGFKYSRPDFQDILSRSLSRGLSVGRGTMVGGTTMVFSQGGFQSTDTVTDLALSGRGFFMVQDSATTNTYYTRAGSFHIDQSGFLVDPSGFRVQGFDVDDTGQPQGVTGDIVLPTAPLQPLATSEITINANLDSRVPYVGPFDPANPENTSNFTTAITVYDSLGNEHQVTAYFTREDAPGPGGGNVWDYNVVVSAEDSATGAAYVAQSGTLEFTTDGALQTHTPSASPANFNFVGAVTQGQAISLNFGTTISDGGTGLDGTTQFAQTSGLVSQSQDGYGPSDLLSLDIDNDGVISGHFGNGQTRSFARVAVVNFANIDGLAQAGGNLFTATGVSGAAIVSVANVAGNGSINSNSLEMSNVDIASQFVDLITTQRAFQANAKAITAASDMLTVTVNMAQ